MFQRFSDVLANNFCWLYLHNKYVLCEKYILLYFKLLILNILKIGMVSVMVKLIL